jgi:divalent metal cation (Fe/Co/Zn/Cd) transporter
MDSALPAKELAAVLKVIKKYEAQGVMYHDLRTRQAASRRFVTVHLLVPGSWTVLKGHRMLERMEADIRGVLADVHVTTHLEPIEEPGSDPDKAEG